MIESLAINNFKKFEHIELKNLARVNIFAGINNVGKTSVLEAVFAYACGRNLIPLLSNTVLHRLSVGDQDQIRSPYPWMEMIWNTFHDKRNVRNFNLSFNGRIGGKEIQVNHHFTPSSILADFLPNEMGAFGDTAFMRVTTDEIKNTQQNLGAPVLQILGRWQTTINGKEGNPANITYPLLSPALPEEPLILAKIDDILSHRNENEDRKIYSFLSRAGLLPQITKEMDRCFPELQLTSIENIPYPDGTAAPISVRLDGKGTYPLYTLGDGLRRWFHLIGSMLVYHDAVHCIEEIDATFHHKAQQELSCELLKYAKKYNNQLFITTHNSEYLQSFLTAIRNDSVEGDASLEKDVRVFTMRNMGEETKLRVLDGKEAWKAVESGLELRI